MQEEKKPNDQQHGKHEWQREFPDVADKGGRVDFLVVGDGFHHEIRAVANVSVCAKKHSADANGNEVFVECGVAEQKTDFDFLFGDTFGQDVVAVIFLQGLEGLADLISVRAGEVIKLNRAGSDVRLHLGD